ncbi:Hachiman antiphage defense system protein HamA, partial [Paenibacillus forsythiae]
VHNKGVQPTLDKINIRIPVLLTYDCNVIPKHTDIEDALFIDEMGKEFMTRYKSIDGHTLTLKPNIEVMFIVIPFESVASIKTEIEKLEVAMR